MSNERYAYITLADGTEITHSAKDNDKVTVHFDRDCDHAACELPSFTWTESEGFSAEEIDFFTKLLHSNEQLIMKYSETGGLGLANRLEQHL